MSASATMGVIRPLGVATATDTSTVSFVTIPVSSPPQRLLASGTFVDGEGGRRRERRREREAGERRTGGRRRERREASE